MHLMMLEMGSKIIRNTFIRCLIAFGAFLTKAKICYIRQNYRNYDLSCDFVKLVMLHKWLYIT